MDTNSNGQFCDFQAGGRFRGLIRLAGSEFRPVCLARCFASNISRGSDAVEWMPAESMVGWLRRVC